MQIQYKIVNPIHLLQEKTQPVPKGRGNDSGTAAQFLHIILTIPILACVYLPVNRRTVPV